MKKLNDLEHEVSDKRNVISNLEGMNKKLIHDWKKDYEGLAKSFEDLNKKKEKRSNSVPPEDDKTFSPYNNYLQNN
jgi:hypothetical protein